MSLLDALEPAVRAAGALIERVRADGVAHRLKADRSPVTIADEQAEALLMDAIRQCDPGTLIVGEEACEAGDVPPPQPRFWLLDPLDGTKDFIAGRDGYTVNVALIENGVPVLGLLLHPPTARLWAGEHGSAWRRRTPTGRREPISTRPAGARPLALVSHSHLDAETEAWLAALGAHDVEPAGSSLKFARLAEGGADLYPRFGPTMEWDTAAGHAVLLAAGGRLEQPDGGPFRYGKPGYRNGAFVARG